MKRTTPKGSPDPGYVRISWDEAYDMIVGHMKRIREKHGPHAVFFYVGDPKEPRAAVQRLAATFGSVNYGDESSTACRKGANTAEVLTYGFGTTGSPPNKNTRSMLIWGTNPPYSGPANEWRDLLKAKERGVKFVVVDPEEHPHRRHPRGHPPPAAPQHDGRPGGGYHARDLRGGPPRRGFLLEMDKRD